MTTVHPEVCTECNSGQKGRMAVVVALPRAVRRDPGWGHAVGRALARAAVEGCATPALHVGWGQKRCPRETKRCPFYSACRGAKLFFDGLSKYLVSGAGGEQ